MGYWCVGVCEQCFNKHWVVPWTLRVNVTNIPAYCVDQPRIRSECDWSPNLNEWVYKTGENANRFLMYDPDPTVMDWFTTDDPHWRTVKGGYGKYRSRMQKEQRVYNAENIRSWRRDARRRGVFTPGRNHCGYKRMTYHTFTITQGDDQ